MATLTAYKPFDINTFPVDLLNGNNIIHTSTVNRYEEATRAYEYRGTDFAYTGPPLFELADGIINEYVFQTRTSSSSWVTTLHITGLSIDYSVATGFQSYEDLRGYIFGGNDVFNGSSGNDVFNGYAGADSFFGGAGDDLYIFDNPGDVVTELPGEGLDTIRSTVGLVVPDNVENVVLLGSAAADLTGNAQANSLSGTSGANVLDGGRGPDALSGLAGHDTYYIDSGADSVTEPAGAGTDEIVSLVSLTLPANVENATAAEGVAVVAVTGNSLNNVIAGNDAANVLDGAGGNDDLSGGGGDDTLIGGDGNDLLSGGDGLDVLLGGAGTDRFRFDVAPDGGNVDRIMDFAPGTDDLEFSTWVFGALTGNFADEFVKGPGVEALGADDYLLYDTSTGQLYYDADGSRTDDAPHLLATLQGAPNLTAGDLLVAS
jgi:Ca2+-binding RTX toxin-like protein